MPPKQKPLSTSQIEAMLEGESDFEDDFEEIFGPRVELEEEEEDIPSTSTEPQASTSAGAQTSGDAQIEDHPDNYDNHVESK